MLNRTVKFKAATFPIGDVAASFSLLSNHGKLETAKGFWFAAAALTCVACNLSDGKRNGSTLLGDSVPRPSAGQRLQRKSEPLLSQRPRLCNHVRSEGPCLRPPLAFTGLREEGKLPGLRRASALQRRVPELARRLIRNQLLSNELRVRVPCPPPFHNGVCEISQALFFMHHLLSAKTRLAAAIFPTAPLRFSLSDTRSPPLQTGLETQTRPDGQALKTRKENGRT